jgi:hypothetical protein
MPSRPAGRRRHALAVDESNVARGGRGAGAVRARGPGRREWPPPQAATRRPAATCGARSRAPRSVHAEQRQVVLLTCQHAVQPGRSSPELWPLRAGPECSAWTCLSHHRCTTLASRVGDRSFPLSLAPSFQDPSPSRWRADNKPNAFEADSPRTQLKAAETANTGDKAISKAFQWNVVYRTIMSGGNSVYSMDKSGRDAQSD